MKPLYRGIAVAAIQCLLVLSIAGKYAFDREHLPRAWAKAAPVDPNLPIRGRYVSLNLQVDYPASNQNGFQSQVLLSARNGRLSAEPADFPTGVSIARWSANSNWRLMEPVAFFLPEHVPDPSRRASGEELWVEVSVPRRGGPRPLRLAVKKDGSFTPLELR